MKFKKLFIALATISFLVLPGIASAARTDALWDYIQGGNYTKPNGSANGTDILIYGINHYLNFGTLTGVNGYGIRDNAGTIECKNSGGSWAACASGGGGGGGSGTVTQIDTTYPIQGGPITTTGTLSLAFGTTTSNIWAATQTFTNSPVLGTLTGLIYGNNGVLNQVATSTDADVASSSQPIVGWGDSLTNGAGGTPYPTQLATLSGRVVTNKGIGGQTSSQIAVREGGIDPTTTISGGTIPGSGGVTVTFPTGFEPVTAQGPAFVNGTLSGVYGAVTLSGVTYTFTRSVSGSPVTVSTAPFIADTGILNQGTVVIWAGRNNLADETQVKSDIAAMVANLGTNTKYLVLGIINSTAEDSSSVNYAHIVAINTYLASTYSGHYFDIREYMVLHGLADEGITPTAQDLIDIGNDTPPTSLRSDVLHLNSSGYNVVAQQVYKFVRFTLTPVGVLMTSNLSSIFRSPFAIGDLNPNTGAFTMLNVATTTNPNAYALNVGGFVNVDQYFGYKQANNTILYASSTNSSVAVGVGAGPILMSSSTVIQNTVLGTNALASFSLSGGLNTALGYLTLNSNTTGIANVAVGANVLSHNTTGNSNVAIGKQTMDNNSTGNNNVGVGIYALRFNTIGTGNVAVGADIGGSSPLYQNVTGIDNTAVGRGAFTNNNSATSSVGFGAFAGFGTGGLYNSQGSTAVGYSSGFNFSTGSDYNTLLGYKAGFNITTGAGNIMIGSATTTANENITTGYNNIKIGNNIAFPGATASNQLNIGNAIYGTGLSGTGSTVSPALIGIGTSSPYAQLSLGGGNLIMGAATAGGTPGDLFLPKLGIAAGTFLAADATGKVIATTSPSGGTSLVGTTGQVAYFSGTNTAVGTSTIFIAPSGSVGIASTSPMSPLSVVGNTYINGNYIHLGNAAPNNAACSSSTAGCGELWGNDNTTSGVQFGVGNANAGTSAYTGFYLNNDLAVNGLTNHYGFIGYNSSGYTDTTFGTGQAVKNELYMQSTDGPLSFFASTTTSPGYINFFTGGTATANERMRIAVNGNVGIGTTSPAVTLDVAGQTRVTSATFPPLEVIRTTAVTNSQVTDLSLQSYSSGVMADGFGSFFNFRVADSVTAPTVLANIGAARNGAANTGDLIFITNNAGSQVEKVRIKNTGFVGVGTSTPSSLLNVYGSDSGTTVTAASAAMADITNADTTANNFSDLAFSGVNSVGSSVVDSKIVGVHTSHTSTSESGSLAFLTRNAGTLSQKATILANGNFGIGTTTPNSPLTITAPNPSNLSGLGLYSGASNAFTTLTLGRTGIDFTMALIGGAGQFAPNTAVGDTFIQANANLFLNSAKLLLNTTGGGFIGMGTTSPYAKFSLAGVSGGTSVLFAISSSTAAFATSTVAQIDANGNLSLLNGSSLTLSALATPAGTFLAADATGKVIATTSPAGGGAVSSVSNSDGTLTISPTTGAVVASIALAHANTWTANQTLNTTGFVKSLRSSLVMGAGNGDGYGVYAEAFGSAGLNTGNAYGIFASSTQSGNGNNSYGGYFQANGDNNANKYSLYVNQPLTTRAYAVYSAAGINYFAGNVGMGSTTPFASLSVVGSGTSVFAVATSTTAGSTNPIFEIDNTGHIITSGPKPTLSSCGSTNIISGNDSNGTIMFTGTLVTACTMTFAQPVKTGATLECEADSGSTAFFAAITATSTTAITFGTSASLSAGTIFYHCDEHI